MNKLKFIVLLCLMLTSFFTVANTDFKEALLSYEQGEYEQSEKQLLALIKLNDKNSDYWLNLGHVYVKQERFAEAHQAYNKVIELKGPDAPLAYYHNAEAAYFEGKYTHAKDYLAGLAIYRKIPDALKKKSDHLAEKIKTQEKILELKEKKKTK